MTVIFGEQNEFNYFKERLKLCNAQIYLPINIFYFLHDHTRDNEDYSVLNLLSRLFKVNKIACTVLNLLS